MELERSRGYQDTAVMGGLDRFLERWASNDAQVLATSEVAKLLKASYAGMSQDQRQEWSGRLLEALSSDGQTYGAGAVAEPSTSAETAEGVTTPRKPARARTGTTAASKRPLLPTVPGASGLSLDSPVDRLRGVDVKTSARLDRLGVSTVKDLIYLFPRHHNDFSNITTISELEPGREYTIIATVWEARETQLGRGRLRATEAVVSDETGNLGVIWFGRSHLAKMLRTNSRVAISGKVDIYKGQLQFQSPEFEVLDRQDTTIHTGRLVPVYPLTQGLTARRLRSIVWQALERCVTVVEDYLPEPIMQRRGLQSLPDALLQAHYPEDQSSLEPARRRLAFDELFLVQMALLARRRSWEEVAEGVSVQPESGVIESFLTSLPFSLTDAQQRCLDEVLVDLIRAKPPMNRLLQGEVGSGKTVVALAALLAAVVSGHQGSIMVPTEVLAEQHFATISQLLGGLAHPLEEENPVTVHLDKLPAPVSVGLLTGSTKGSVKKELQKRASEGSLDIIIGTHALIQEGVEIPKLALAVVDEQHRFGVTQRASLRQRGTISPHVLVMSATPIPRTLALTLYGDLDISTIDQLPPGRQQIRTRHVQPERRSEAYDFVRKQVSDGRQAFVICPLIEESEAVEAKAATVEYKRLSTEVFPDLKLGLLHGRMPARDKDRIMRSFRDGEIDILVSTPVVEVGIDVPNATVMVIEGAHRFGLSQLHQFRGRVGRGEHKSYCLLLSEYSTGEAKERLSAVESIHDGFQLAEVDLSLRGPGDYFGTRQSGLPTLRVARLSDQDLLKAAREEAAELIKSDPDLEEPEHKPLAAQVSRFLDRVRDEVS